MSNSLVLRPYYAASVSGGKDSLYMMKIIFENPDRYPLNGVFHMKVETDFPFIADVVQKIKEACEERGIPFIEVTPSKTWAEMYEKYGYPTRPNRWCNQNYKFSAEQKLVRTLSEKGMYLVRYIGFCADEEKRFKVALNERGQKIRYIYPLAEMGIKENTIWLWARENPIFGEYYKFNYRCGCMCCPMSSLSNLAYTFSRYPDEYKRLMRLARETENRYFEGKRKEFSVWRGRPKENTDFIDAKVRKIAEILKPLPVPVEQISMFD